MERINQFSFYQLAKSLSGLSDFREDTSPSVVLWELVTIQGVVNRLLDGVPIPLGVSRASVETLKGLLDDLEATHFMTEGEDGSPTFSFPVNNAPSIPSWTFDVWRTALASFETVFAAEMAEAATYYIPKSPSEKFIRVNKAFSSSGELTPG